jgi:hypothetical protein
MLQTTLRPRLEVRFWALELLLRISDPALQATLAEVTAQEPQKGRTMAVVLMVPRWVNCQVPLLHQVHHQTGSRHLNMHLCQQATGTELLWVM